MKGIILAGGRGTRLYPSTLSTCKQLLPIYDKPMIYYPLSVLMLAGIREILIISTPQDIERFQAVFQDGSALGLSISYATQHLPRGIADAFIIGERFINHQNVALILGDNIFYGHNLSSFLHDAAHLKKGGMIFGYEVKDPERYGVIAFNEKQEMIDIIEKPKQPPSHYAVTGLYFYDQEVVDIAKELRPSERGELEITDLNHTYLQRGDLALRLFDRGFAWLDTGTCDALQSAATYVQAIQARQGIKIACIEEIAYKMGYIDEEQFLERAQFFSQSEYGTYLFEVAQKFSRDLTFL
ncbi:MAG TPA: glucose-1-phosphate thymidylyltransferase RfbA [Rhabdochlamydiaceae bacterium]|nr:glucose-1-phosphate thymidylyltransferase RfbA [Rhabdochlamydiaceae bacterium]